MGQGLEVYSPAGNKVFSSEWGNARVLGSFKPSTATGSRSITTSDGVPAYNVFAYIVPFVEFYGGTSSYSNAVWTEGNTIYWENLTSLGFTIVYGDGYK